MRHYNTCVWEPNETLFCECGNVVFSTLPRTIEPLTELTWCGCCGQTVVFSTVAPPIEYHNPLPRAQWGHCTPILATTKLRKARAKRNRRAFAKVPQLEFAKVPPV